MTSCPHALRWHLRHKSVKFVIIDDARVIGASACVMLAVVVYTIFGIFVQKEYMAIETPFGFSNMWGSGYDSHGWAPANLCNESSRYDFEYDATWTYFGNQCREFGYGEVIRKLESGGLYIQTYTQDSRVAKQGCVDDARGCAGTRSTSANYFVPGVDGIMLGFSHTYSTPGVLARVRSEQNVETEILDTHGRTIKHVAAGVPVSLSLADLLQAAGIDGLDDANTAGTVADSVGVPAYRMTGATLDMQVIYSNLDSFTGETTKATLRVSKAKVGWSGLGAETDFVDLTTAGDDAADYARYNMTFIEKYSYGIKVTVSFGGNIGEPDFFALMSVLAKTAALIAAAPFVADFVAQYLLGKDSSEYYTAKNDYDHTKAIQNPYEGGDKTTETTGSAGQNEDHDARVASEQKDNRAEA